MKPPPFSPFSKGRNLVIFRNYFTHDSRAKNIFPTKCVFYFVVIVRVHVYFKLSRKQKLETLSKQRLMQNIESHKNSTQFGFVRNVWNYIKTVSFKRYPAKNNTFESTFPRFCRIITSMNQSARASSDFRMRNYTNDHVYRAIERTVGTDFISKIRSMCLAHMGPTWRLIDAVRVRQERMKLLFYNEIAPRLLLVENGVARSVPRVWAFASRVVLFVSKRTTGPSKKRWQFKEATYDNMIRIQ